MVLLQISEPGVSSAPHARRFAIGIDLGTTHSLVATVQHGLPEVLRDEKGRAMLPSVVHYRPDGITVGDSASRHLDPCNTIVSVKRMMGRGLEDILHREHLPYDFYPGKGMVEFATCAGRKNPVAVSAEILKTLKQRACAVLGQEPLGAVITVPAYFDEGQRQATRDAAEHAGLHVLRLLNEPTAAAIAYKLDQKTAGTYVVYDLGGGTFDISILKLSQGVFEVLATGGDTALGGDDFDQRLFCWVIEKAELAPLSARDTAKLMQEVRRAKEALSFSASTEINAQLSTGEILLSLTRENFKVLTQHLVDKTLEHIRQTLRDAQISVEQLDGVILVGGATRMPAIRDAVTQFFQKTPLTQINPDEVVALGAALHADVLAGNRLPGENLLLLDVIPLSLGVETIGGLVEKIIPRNTALPCVRAQDFTTFQDGQTALSIHVLQGEREQACHCRSLSRFELRGIPPMVAGAVKIRITYHVDADGLLSVSAKELHSGVQAAITVTPSYGLREEIIQRMLQEKNQHDAEDAAQKALMEAKIAAKQLIIATKTALDADQALLSPQEETAITQQLKTLELCDTNPDCSLEMFTAETEALAQITQDFAARRMNHRIQKALSGQSLETLIK